MSEKKTKQDEGEVSETQLENVAGGVVPSINVKISNITGESNDDGHKDWIEILPDVPPPKTG